jgi:hypothetical protein
MEKYLIELETKVNGEWQKGYHQDLTNNNNKQAMNVYVQHVTTDKRKAKRFYDKEEAQKFATLFESKFQTAKVITINR